MDIIIVWLNCKMYNKILENTINYPDNYMNELVINE